MKKVILIVLNIVLVCIVVACSSTNNSSVNNASQIVSLKDDFYEAVNYNELNSWQIADDSSSISILSMLEDKNHEIINEMMVSIYNSKPDISQKDEYNIAALYETANDYNARNNGGYGKLDECINNIDKAENINALLKTSLECSRKYGLIPAFAVAFTVDFANSNNYIYYALINKGLEKESWFSTNTLYADSYINYLKKILILNGTAEQEAESIVKSVTDIMKEIANVSLSIEDSRDPFIIYNVRTLTEFTAMLNNAVTVDDIKTIYGITDDTAKFLVTDIKALEKFASYLTEDNLELLKNYIKICIYETYAEYTTIEHENAYIEYQKSINGLVDYSLEKDINTNLQDILKYELGRQYYKKYFTAEMQQDILKIIDEVKKIYEKRINSLSWMSAETKAKAINKLKAMKSVVGVDDSAVWPQDLYNYTFTKSLDGGLYINNVLDYTQAEFDYFMKELAAGNPVNRNTVYAPQTVNAFYSLSNNTITILPGIAQAPVYSLESSMEEKLGGIGTIIAHEITHAFDSNGAKYDEFGNYGASWWTDKDMAAYTALQQKTIDYYSGYQLNNINVNGKLTLSENIADLGAVSCLTEYAKSYNYNLQNLYISYAKLWATKIRPEALESQLLTDFHAPAKIRANAVLSATDDFYTAFEIKETDGMYKPKEVRPSIW